MTRRGLALALFLLVPAVVGAVIVVRAATADGTPRCDGIIKEYGDAERSGVMKPGETCDLYDFADGRSAGTRTYDQQKKAQEEEASDDYLVGGLLLVYGLAAPAVTWKSRRP
ncbi:hypothetical protein [Streptomyces lancefieldiae]|uniref:Secreted protein n=1 Tax=Streptomyces lancefieldiae TaxID=3075520 RepID=A0ABU3AVD2_9ACTN|nr:hypothetical protein [Streptomyces sp. DSM 40712]MDT0613815.1 hypothetical protein [Streptomyces sp. DSM 40712]